jgi:hypothetical protein
MLLRILRPLAGVRVFTAENQPSGERGQVKLRWSPDSLAARYLIAFVDTVDDAHYTAQELFAERTLYSGSDTATTINAPGDTARINYAIVSENSQGRSQPRYATKVAGTIPKDTVSQDLPPEGVKSLTAALQFLRGSAYHNFALRWQPDPRTDRYTIAYSLNRGPFQRYSSVSGSDTTAIVWPPITGATIASFTSVSFPRTRREGRSRATRIPSPGTRREGPAYCGLYPAPLRALLR